MPDAEALSFMQRTGISSDLGSFTREEDAASTFESDVRERILALKLAIEDQEDVCPQCKGSGKVPKPRNLPA